MLTAGPAGEGALLGLWPRLLSRGTSGAACPASPCRRGSAPRATLAALACEGA